MSVRINFQDVRGDIPAADRHWIMGTLEAVRDRAAPRLELADADVNVVVAPATVIPEYGIGGTTFNRRLAQIAVDPWSPRMREPEREMRLGSVLAHELHHMARFRHPASGWSPERLSCASLGHALLAEGLAQAFEEEMGFPLPFQATAVAGPPLWDLADRARTLFEATEFDYDAWFDGRMGDAAFPRHGGYALGYAIVRGWMMNMETTASEEIGLETGEVLQAWRTGRLEV